MPNCEVCGSNYLVQKHHSVSGRGKRKQHEDEFNTFYLCWNCHHGNEGAHGKNGRPLNLKLKGIAQERYFSMGYSEDEVRQMMGGRLY